MIASLALACLVPILLWVAAVDFRTREIPDAGSFLVALSGAALWLDNPQALAMNLLLGAIIYMSLSFAGELAWWRTGREWLGLGDAKLIGAGAIVVGWSVIWVMLFLASVGAILAGVVGRLRRREEGLPFGPFLAYAILVTHLIAGPSR
jgi:prepilin signal peptidase PulO-like enzyme (type II secretory pathway)